MKTQVHKCSDWRGQHSAYPLYQFERGCGGGTVSGDCNSRGQYFRDSTMDGLGTTITDKWESTGMKGQCNAVGRGFG